MGLPYWGLKRSRYGTVIQSSSSGYSINRIGCGITVTILLVRWARISDAMCHHSTQCIDVKLKRMDNDCCSRHLLQHSNVTELHNVTFTHFVTFKIFLWSLVFTVYLMAQLKRRSVHSQGHVNMPMLSSGEYARQEGLVPKFYCPFYSITNEAIT